MRTGRNLLILVLVSQLIACEEDVVSPVAEAPYPVVHCILNRNDTAHYVRLTKTFSGARDALEMAQDLDSLYFKEAYVYFEMEGTESSIDIRLFRS